MANCQITGRYNLGLPSGKTEHAREIHHVDLNGEIIDLIRKTLGNK